PGDRDEGWSVEVAFPWAGLAGYNKGRANPPRPGDLWKVNFSRVQWKHEVVDGKYVRIPPHGTPLAE
ncbi:MAG: carbohydrate-binding family 9-like protein, partial [Akkermansiaceae bacterium]|nr:carbohydrate-binding family 9-like protein [Akkermansiaceae bacterium]